MTVLNIFSKVQLFFISQEKSLPSINNKLTINNMNLENFFQLNFSLRHGKIPVYQRMNLV